MMPLRSKLSLAVCSLVGVLLSTVAALTAYADESLDAVIKLETPQLESKLKSDPSTGGRLFARANAAFESDDFAKAVLYYETLVRGGKASETLYLNLGTAHFRNGSPGRAVLWFRRASLLNPDSPEVRQNFKFLSMQLGMLSFSDGEWQQRLLAMSPTALTWFACLCLWLVALAVLAICSGFRPQLRPAYYLVAFFSLCASVTLFWLLDYRTDRLDPVRYATIIEPDTSALVAPAPDSAPVIALPVGSEVFIVEDTGPWIYASIPGDLIGWVHHSAIEQNWPLPE